MPSKGSSAVSPRNRIFNKNGFPLISPIPYLVRRISASKSCRRPLPKILLRNSHPVRPSRIIYCFFIEQSGWQMVHPFSDAVNWIHNGSSGPERWYAFYYWFLTLIMSSACLTTARSKWYTLVIREFHFNHCLLALKFQASTAPL